jgi:hypothetical protein
MRRALLADILRKIADAIEKSSVDELEDFDVELTPKKMRHRALNEHESRANKKADLAPKEAESLLDELMKSATREAASDILDKLDLTRKELVDLARPRSVHVTKDDNVKRIKEKLIEAIVGSRLNSLAIRGK